MAISLAGEGVRLQNITCEVCEAAGWRHSSFEEDESTATTRGMSGCYGFQDIAEPNSGLPDSLSLQDSTHAASYRKSSRMAISGIISLPLHCSPSTFLWNQL